MHRRTFLAGVPLVTLAAACTTTGSDAPPQGATEADLRRLGVTTVSFRQNFRPPLGPPSTVGPTMDMMSAPQIIRRELGLRNIEVWSLQFQDLSLDYSHRLRAAMDAAGCRVSNVQVDADYDLSSPDPIRRRTSITTIKSWMDRAAALGSPSVRANIDAGKPGSPLVLAPATLSFRELAEYGREKGIKVLVENHIGASFDIDNCVALLAAVNHPFCRAIVDWGNSRSTTEEGRISALSKMFTYLDLVSAKGLHFDPAFNHMDYPIAPIVEATEASGFTGLYSIELFAETGAPADPFTASRAMIEQILPGLRNTAARPAKPNNFSISS